MVMVMAEGMIERVREKRNSIGMKKGHSIQMLLKQQLKWNLSVTYLAHSLRRRIYFFSALRFGQFAGVVVFFFGARHSVRLVSHLIYLVPIAGHLDQMKLPAI